MKGLYDEVPKLAGKLKEKFDDAGETASPIVLDLNGDGVQTVGLKAGVHFDHDGNGFSELTGWVSQGDALLVYDENSNGLIDGGGELFGNNYSLGGVKAKNGFEALSDFDSNHDGVVGSNDEAFSKLKIWKDSSMDGLTNEGELLSLSEADIASFDLRFNESDYVDENGNEHRQVGGFTWSEGSVSSMSDVWFRQEKSDTEIYQYIAVSEAVSTLPDLVGFGNVYDLHQAMSLDGSGHLKVLVESFITERVVSRRKEIVDEIIFAWSGADKYSPDSRGDSVLDARRLYAVEAFVGETFVQGEGTNAGLNDPGFFSALKLEEGFELVSDYYYALLSIQVFYERYTSQVIISFNEIGYALDSSVMVSLLRNNYRDNTLSQDEILDFFQSIKALGSYGEKLLFSIREMGDGSSDSFDSLTVRC